MTFTLLYSTAAVGKQTNTNVNIECDTGKKKYALKFEKMYQQEIPFLVFLSFRDWLI